ncbi:MAG: nuclease SbcCD subunit C [Clostridioides sp.]|jgi:exonuclease SbcC|nr:nuclease SbcCD subunit C [Clostridioides sp.]
MRPVKLEISGLNSYIEKQTIDFRKLTGKGLFGIFGPTGSGKSTILDGITLAMYGNIARNTKEFINSLCSEAVLSFEFELGNDDSSRKFCVERIIKKKDEDGSGIKTTYAKLAEYYNDGTVNVLADKVNDVNNKILDVIGLTADDFTRSVVLPQGKFNEFLKLTGANRRDMLERIFNLEKYGRDLTEKIRKQKSSKTRELKDIQAKLSQYEGVSQEAFDKSVENLEVLKKQEKEKNEKLEQVQNKYDLDKIDYDKKVKLEFCLRRKRELEVFESDIEEKRLLIDKSQRATMIEPKIDYFEELESRKRKNTRDFEELKQNLTILNKDFEVIKFKYKEISSLEEREMPTLNQQKIRYSNAIDIEKELDILKEEIERLSLDIKKTQEETSKIKDSGLFLNSDLEKLSKKIKDVDESLSNISISVELKQRIFSAYNLEKEYIELENKKKEKEEQREILNEIIRDITTKSIYNQNEVEKNNKFLDDEVAKLESINLKYSNAQKYIVEKSNNLIELKNKFEIIKKNEIQKQDIEEKLNKYVEEIAIIKRNINLKLSALDSEEKNKNILEENLIEFKLKNQAYVLRKNLVKGKRCPVCGSTEHNIVESVDYFEEIIESERELEKSKSNCDILSNELKDLNLNRISFEEKYNILSAQMENIKVSIGEYSSTDIEHKISQEKMEYNIISENINLWSKEKIELEKQIAYLSEQRNKKSNNQVLLEEQLNNRKREFENISLYLTNSEEKYLFVRKNYFELRNLLKIDDLENEVEKINFNERNIEILSKEKNNLLLEKYSVESKIKELENDLYNKKIELTKFEDALKYKSSIRKEKLDSLTAITKGKTAQILLDEVEEKIKSISEKKREIEILLNDKKNEYERNLINKDLVEIELNKNISEFDKLEKEIKEILVINKFKDSFEVKKSIIEKITLEEFQEDVNKYYNDVRLIQARMDELKDEKINMKIDEKDLEEMRTEMVMLKTSLSSITKELGKEESNFEHLKKSLEVMKILQKSEKEVSHRLDLLEDLDKLVQGNKFVEYVATNQLKYIAFDATQRLSTISRGRYAIEIDENQNFVIRDDFNGGQRRKADTLSGGETFLTSLSLALALSSQIQLKGKSPLQFFFLDEGFGSLDAELLEIVIDSLERLHSDNMCVGIISHIEELKNRVPVKLIVSASEPGEGSKVHIELS